MAIIKCKMCGGDLDISEGMNVAQCEYCGTRQTVPNVDSEKKVTLFSRAGRLRLACEFDKAAGVYENLVSEFPEEAEAYWGLVLCKYGIEYVDDPATGKKVPTCHRSSFESILEDSDFEQACENADSVARRVYREEAKAIEELRKGILEVSGKEPPYDIFICYKETDENGERTVDSVLAQDVYDALTEKGYRVFFSRITLEDKLGTEYEPYIFAALNSAKIMLVFGTDYEYFNAVWVKNEWSRYLKLMAGDKSRHLIPCYKDVDAYDMPKEFQKLQAQDLGKVGAVQDLLRGIDKLLGKSGAVLSAPTAAPAGGPTMESLLKRGKIFLTDRNWNSAKQYFDKVLDMDPECAEAYVGQFCADINCDTLEQAAKESVVAHIVKNPNYKKAVQFGDDALRAQLENMLMSVQKNSDAKLQREKAKQQERIARREVEEKRRRAEEEAHLIALARHREENRTRLPAIRARAEWAAALLATNDFATLGLTVDGTVMSALDPTYFRSQCLEDWRPVKAVGLGRYIIAGLHIDGTVTVAAPPSVVVDGINIGNTLTDTQSWTGIVAVSVGAMHVIGLRADGTVVAAGNNTDGQCNVADWTGIVSVSAGSRHTVGLRADGTIVAAGKNDEGQCNVAQWRDISSVIAYGSNTIGLRADGTVAATGKNNEGQCNVADWKDIVAVAAGGFHTVGLRADGTVVAAGRNEYGQCNVEQWEDIVAVAEGSFTTIGLKADGTVVAVGSGSYDSNQVDDWTDIVAISAKFGCTLGLRADGTVAVAGRSKKKDQENARQLIRSWKLFDHIETLEEERRVKLPRAALESERAALQAELANLKGLFSGKRRKEIEARLAEIEAELKKL